MQAIKENYVPRKPECLKDATEFIEDYTVEVRPSAPTPMPPQHSCLMPFHISSKFCAVPPRCYESTVGVSLR